MRHENQPELTSEDLNRINTRRSRRAFFAPEKHRIRARARVHDRINMSALKRRLKETSDGT